MNLLEPDAGAAAEIAVVIQEGKDRGNRKGRLTGKAGQGTYLVKGGLLGVNQVKLVTQVVAVLLRVVHASR